MDTERLIERNKSVALSLYGDRLDEDRNIVGTNYYFDDCWRLRTRKEVAAKEDTPMNEEIKNAFLTLVRHCADHDDCDGCLFFRKETGCIFSCGELPSKWKFPKNCC